MGPTVPTIQTGTVRLRVQGNTGEEAWTLWTPELVGGPGMGEEYLRDGLGSGQHSLQMQSERGLALQKPGDPLLPDW